MRKHKVGVLTLGCSKNTVDSERLIGQLLHNNCRVIDDPNKADVVIINTCGFIADAKEESINAILNAVEMKKEGKLKKVIVAGCLSQRFKDELRIEIPEVDVYFGVEDYEGIVKELGGELKYELLGERQISTPKHYAYLKISEGCNQSCSFCAIPLIRGRHRSFSYEHLIKETELLASKGVKEIVLIGQDTTDYGIDLYGKRTLSELIEKLSLIDGIEWIRLLYAYPSHFPKDAIELFSNNPKLLKYVDMPLQHISDKMLKSMRRGITSTRTRELITKLKSAAADMTIRSTFIVGYPGETEADFNELCEFIKEVKFDRIGVFKYSPEEGTVSYGMTDLAEEIKEERRDILMNIQKEISLEKNRVICGRKIKVLVDGKEGKYFVARSEKDAPEVDGEVLIEYNDSIRPGCFYEVEIFDCNEYDLFGRVC